MNFDIPQSTIHGDFTFDNIIHKNGEFYLIDANPTSLNSIYFDGSKIKTGFRRVLVLTRTR